MAKGSFSRSAKTSTLFSFCLSRELTAGCQSHCPPTQMKWPDTNMMKLKPLGNSGAVCFLLTTRWAKNMQHWWNKDATWHKIYKSVAVYHYINNNYRFSLMYTVFSFHIKENFPDSVLNVFPLSLTDTWLWLIILEVQILWPHTNIEEWIIFHSNYNNNCNGFVLFV